MHYHAELGEYDISTDPTHLDSAVIHAYLSQSYWSPGIPRIRRFMLATKDAHGLYRQSGFNDLANPARMMEILDPDVYRPC